MAEELHPEAREFLDRTQGGPPLHKQTPAEARANQRQNAIPSQDPEPVDTVHDVVIRSDGHGLPLRIYVPAGEGPFPILVWAHGGGFVLGDIETEDPLGRALANAGDCIVVSVDYRLAPEHQFPAALRDMYNATKWITSEAERYGGDSDSIAVGGASAGGALAAGLSLLARDEDGPSIAYQVLAYPAVNHDLSFQSVEKYDGLFLTLDEMEWVADQRFDDDLHRHNPYANPLLADDLTDLPPATVVVAGHDPLKDAYETYADRLASAGVDVTVRRYEDMIHSFFGRIHEPEWERSREAVNAVGGDLRDFFGGTTDG